MDKNDASTSELIQFRTSVIKLPKNTVTPSILKIRKRNGNIVDFDINRIQVAIEKAFDACQADK